MKHKMMPITALRDTAKFDEMVASCNGPIFITKNGYEDFVVVPQTLFDDLSEPRVQSFEPRVAPKRSSMQLEQTTQDDPLGFVRVMCPSIKIEVAGVNHNLQQIKRKIVEANEKKVHVLNFQELTLTGYTCGDLFSTKTLLAQVEKAVAEIAAFSASYDMLIAFGAPLMHNNSIFNCAILVHKGSILGVVPKYFLPNYGEFYEKRHFQKAPQENSTIVIAGKTYPFGNKLVFFDKRYVDLKIGVEICEDVWAPNNPSTGLCLVGATLILNLSASNDTIGKAKIRRDLILSTSAKLVCAYAYADSGEGESTTDVVFGGHQMIAENGEMQSEVKLFSGEDAIADIDIDRLTSLRSRTSSFVDADIPGYEYIGFDMEIKAPETPMHPYLKNPFLPASKGIDLEFVSSTIMMQAMGLAKRLETIHQKKAIIGLSGGLDSTLALLVTVEAFKRLGYDLKGVTAITLPAFGTSQRTHDNAKLLAESLGVSFLEINVKEAVIQHLKDINHPLDNHNVTYENAQARERTQVLMDYANDNGALMVGTGDLSELCLGWCTYNGDHMSMYSVNASIPKTMVKYLCKGYGLLHEETAKALNDIIDTPISPELLPTDSKGEIAQLTEDVVGPYELHDFFIFHFLKYAYRPKKIFSIAKKTWGDVYDDASIKKWMAVFFKKFFMNQFKRSCVPDGPKVGPLSISPRGDLRMPSDASVADYLAEINDIC